MHLVFFVLAPRYLSVTLKIFRLPNSYFQCFLDRELLNLDHVSRFPIPYFFPALYKKRIYRHNEIKSRVFSYSFHFIFFFERLDK